MKKVAGRLRLDLAQYRELEAFSQFGSELDAATQQALARGERMVATLNQPQYQPWPVEEQVVAIYAGINGYLDKVPVGQVPRFQEELRETLRSEGGDLRGDPRDAATSSDETTAKLDEALKKFVDGVQRRGGEGRSSAEPMASVQDYKRRIRSVRNTRKITRAMELVAAAKLRRAQARIEAMRPYADTMRELIAGRRPRRRLGARPAAAAAARDDVGDARSSRSPATAGSPARSTRRCCGARSRSSGELQAEGTDGALARRSARRAARR